MQEITKNNKNFMTWFGNGAVEDIYEFLLPKEMAGCAQLCKLHHNGNMHRIADRVFRRIIKRIASTHLFSYSCSTTPSFAPLSSFLALHELLTMLRQQVFLLGVAGINNFGCTVPISLIKSCSALQVSSTTKPVFSSNTLGGGGGEVENMGEEDIFEGSIADIGDNRIVAPSWSTLPGFNINRKCFAVVRLRRYFFVISGYHGQASAGTVECFDVFSRRWIMLINPLPLPQLRHVSTAVLNGRLYIIGGYYLKENSSSFARSDSIFTLDENPSDISASTWTTLEAKLSTARSRHASVTYRGKIFVAGGWDSNDRILRTVEVYDPRKQRFEIASEREMVRGRGSLDLVIVEDNLFAVGGADSCVFSIEKYNWKEGNWTVIAEVCGMAGLKKNFTSVALGGKILVFGGATTQGRVVKSGVWTYFDVEKSIWGSISTVTVEGGEGGGGGDLNSVLFQNCKAVAFDIQSHLYSY